MWSLDDAKKNSGGFDYRFTWQAKMSDRIEVRWGDATTQLQKLREPIDFLLLDAKPSEYLDYLKAAEQLLSPGSIIVADNAGNVCEISWRTRYSQVIQV